MNLANLISTYQYQWAIILEDVRVIRGKIDLNSISPTLVELLIAAEDHRYGYHPGVDLRSLCRAIWRSVICGKREGGSTIAMQLVRVLTGRYEKTVIRKALEILLAVRLTKYLPESELPKLYLTVAYYGWRMNGLKQACTRLELKASDISKKDAARLIARLKYPEPRYCNERRRNQISRRARHILLRHKDLIVDALGRSRQEASANGII